MAEKECIQGKGPMRNLMELSMASGPSASPMCRSCCDIKFYQIMIFSVSLTKHLKKPAVKDGIVPHNNQPFLKVS